MNLKYASLIVLIICMAMNLNAQTNTQIPKTKIVIYELTKKKSTGIILTEAEMTRLVFDEIEKLENFDIQYLSSTDSPEKANNAQLIIQGKYELDANLISLSYQITSLKPKMRFKQSVNRVELNIVKNEVLTNFQELFPLLTIITDPTECNLAIDGIEFGKTPITIRNLINGEHLLSISKTGYFTSNMELLEIAESETIRVNLTKQTMLNEATPPEPKEGMDAIFSNIQYHKNVQNHPFYKNHALEGEVVIAVEVSKDGKVKNTQIIKSFGDKALDDAALDGIRSVEWKPSLLNNEAVDGKTLVRIKFKSVR